MKWTACMILAIALIVNGCGPDGAAARPAPEREAALAILPTATEVQFGLVEVGRAVHTFSRYGFRDTFEDGAAPEAVRERAHELTGPGRPCRVVAGISFAPRQKGPVQGEPPTAPADEAGDRSHADDSTEASASTLADDDMSGVASRASADAAVANATSVPAEDDAQMQTSAPLVTLIYLLQHHRPLPLTEDDPLPEREGILWERRLDGLAVGRPMPHTEVLAAHAAPRVSDPVLDGPELPDVGLPLPESDLSPVAAPVADARNADAPDAPEAPESGAVTDAVVAAGSVAEAEADGMAEAVAIADEAEVKSVPAATSDAASNADVAAAVDAGHAKDSAPVDEDAETAAAEASPSVEDTAQAASDPVASGMNERESSVPANAAADVTQPAPAGDLRLVAASGVMVEIRGAPGVSDVVMERAVNAVAARLVPAVARERALRLEMAEQRSSTPDVKLEEQADPKAKIYWDLLEKAAGKLYEVKY